jgi:DNA polymerase-3 subunit gamma/tau
MAQASKGSDNKSSGNSALPYRVLARKYRPVDFTTLIGQEAMVRTLRNAIATGRIAHAFMLTGVRGVGKTTTARIIARALNCVGPDGKGGPTVDPCGVCDNCKAITEDRHVDVIEMDAASRTGIDDVRELIEGVRYRPVSARYKVYIIDEVHMLSEKAFNALLKTLEEPPPHVKFLFATTEIRKVPVTVLSRCQRFDLKRVSQETLIAHFAGIAATEKVEISPEALVLLARAADGSVRDGLSMLDQAIAHGGGVVDAAQVRDMLGLADRSRVLELFEKTMKGDAPAVVASLGEMHDSGADPVVVLQDLLELTHWVTRLKVAPEAAASSADSERVQGLAMAAKLSMASLTRAWTLLLKGLQETSPRLAGARRRDGADPPCYAPTLPPSDALKALQNGGSWAARRSVWPSGPALLRCRIGGTVGDAARRDDRCPAGRSAAQSEKLHRDRGPVRGPPRSAPGASFDAPRARGALRAGPDRIPARAAGPARPCAAPRRDAGPLDRPTLDRLGVERPWQTDAHGAESEQRRFAAQPGRGRSDGAGHPEDISRRQARCRAAQGRPDVPGGRPRRRGRGAARGRRVPGRRRHSGKRVLMFDKLKDLGGLMQQAQAMQQKMQELQAVLERLEIVGSSGAGLVKVTVNGKNETRKVEIDASLFVPADKGVVEDLIVAAANDARTKVEQTVQEQMRGITGGMTLPPGFKL